MEAQATFCRPAAENWGIQCVYSEGMQGYYSYVHTLGRLICLGVNITVHPPTLLLKPGSYTGNISRGKTFNSRHMQCTSLISYDSQLFLLFIYIFAGSAKAD